MRKRKIKKYAGMWVIKLNPIDVEDFGLTENDIVDIDDLNLMQMEKTESELSEEEIIGAVELGTTGIGEQDTEQGSVLNQEELEEGVADFLLNESAKIVKEIDLD